MLISAIVSLLPENHPNNLTAWEKLISKIIRKDILLILSFFFIAIIIALGSYTFVLYLESQSLDQKVHSQYSLEETLKDKLQQTDTELINIKNIDQVKLNKNLEGEIKNIQNTYNKATLVYENLKDYTGDKSKLNKYETIYALALKQLADKNYASAEGTLNSISQQLLAEKPTLVGTASTNLPPVAPSQVNIGSAGYKRQNVQIDIGTYLVDIISADLNSTKVIVDTASDSDCKDNCPVLSLGDYVSRNGAFAGVNGGYFCPQSYPTCAGKTNSFDTLLMNKNKKYFNSDNNVYSSVPAVIFSGNSARFVSASSQWGRDTNVDAVLANHPLMVLNNQVVFGGNSDPKQGNKGSRAFVGATGSTAYIGVVHNVTVAESARVLQAIGIQNALNLDSGGSTALWSGGYKVGPGRSLPNALLFVKK
jgi:hypothetical protein